MIGGLFVVAFKSIHHQNKMLTFHQVSLRSDIDRFFSNKLFLLFKTVIIIRTNSSNKIYNKD